MNSIEKSKLAVFDFDETLVKSKHVFAAVNEGAMKELNLPYSKELIGRIFACYDKEYVGWGKNLEEQISIYNEKFSPKVTELCNRDEFINAMAFYDGMKDVILNLSKTDVSLAVASSRDVYSILKFLKKEHIKDCFSMIEATEGGINFKDKPDTQIVNYIAQEEGIFLKDSVMIGDSPSDIIMGKNAGMKTIGIGFGRYFKIEDLNKAGADIILSNEKDIKNIPVIINSLLDKTK